MFIITARGSLRPQRTVRASFPAYSSGTFKAVLVKGTPAVHTALLNIKVVICMHSFAKSALHFVLLQKYWSYSDRKGLASAFTFT